MTSKSMNISRLNNYLCWEFIINKAVAVAATVDTVIEVVAIVKVLINSISYAEKFS